jgi:hypothetical protein
VLRKILYMVAAPVAPPVAVPVALPMTAPMTWPSDFTAGITLLDRSRGIGSFFRYLRSGYQIPEINTMCVGFLLGHPRDDKSSSYV